jgi:hypothetical protein
LQGVNLQGAKLRKVNLQGADLNNTLANLQCPSEGSFTAFKKCQIPDILDRSPTQYCIVKLEIPAEARRSSATSRKCRAEFAKVIEIFGAEEAVSHHDSSFIYRVGEIVRCDKWNDDRWVECGGGIHFFITKEEAEAY